MTTDYPNDADGAVLADLAKRGVDMTASLMIEFPVIAPDEASAKAISEAFAKAGYDSQIEYDEGEPDEDGEIHPDDEEFGPSWDVYTNIQMIPEYTEIMRVQADLNRLAAPFGGRSDGWGVMLE